MTEPKSTGDSWSVSPADLAGMTPVRARDLLVECFANTQGEVFAHAASELHLAAGEQELRDTVRELIELAFADLGLDYRRPTAGCIHRVAAKLAAEAVLWGIPQDVVDRSMAEFEKVEAALSA